jgi:hypothetical protein
MHVVILNDDIVRGLRFHFERNAMDSAEVIIFRSEVGPAVAQWRFTTGLGAENMNAFF